jgi:phosphopentomutase
MSRAVLIVLDGLGVGPTADVAQARPQDRESNSLAHALAKCPVDLFNLTALGLGHAAPGCGLVSTFPPRASWGRSELGYPGADSFLGHQVMMGAELGDFGLMSLGEDVRRYLDGLTAAGHKTELRSDQPVLVVDDAIVVADSLEADPGLNYNVTGALDRVSFEHVLGVAKLVRELAPVARIVAVGGTDITLEDIIGTLRRRNGVIGVDTPALGVYGTAGIRLAHLGRDFDHDGQAPMLIRKSGLPVSLIGKMADVVWCPGADRRPIVPTGATFDALREAMAQQTDGLIAVNVQELDLAGHREDPVEYMDVLAASDAGIGEVRRALQEGDLMIITADHGDDPTTGPMHTREQVPVLATVVGGSKPRPLGQRSSLADTGATIAEWLGVGATSVGDSYADLLA